MLRVRVPIVVGVLVLASCAFEPAGDRPIEPPAFYREWWAKTEACSSRRADFDKVEWYAVPGNGFDCPSGRCAGRWDSSHKIYIAEDWANNELVVRHEILHELLGHPGHPNPPFGADCPLTWETWTAGSAAVAAVPVGPLPPHID